MMNVRRPQGRRRRLRAVGALPLVVALSAGAASSADAATVPSRAVSSGSGAAASPAPALTAGNSASLEKQLRRAFGSSADDVSVAVHDRRTGRIYTYNDRLENCTGSIVKVMVLVSLIRERRSDGHGLTSAQRALAERMIRQSDNDATTSLLRQAGGPSALARLASAAGMTHTTTAASWGRTSTTARDQMILMDGVVSPRSRLLSSADRKYVLNLMGHVSAEQAWGVGKVPSGAKAWVKNGWVPLEPRGWRVNSIGRVSGLGRDYTMAVLSYDNASMDAGVKHMNDASRIVFAHLAPSGKRSVGIRSTRIDLAALSQPHPLW